MDSCMSSETQLPPLNNTKMTELEEFKWNSKNRKIARMRYFGDEEHTKYYTVDYTP